MRQDLEHAILTYLAKHTDLPPTFNALRVHCYRQTGATCRDVTEALVGLFPGTLPVPYRARHDLRLDVAALPVPVVQEPANPAPVRAQTAAPLSEGRPGAYTSPALALLMVARDVCFEAAAVAARRSAA